MPDPRPQGEPDLVQLHERYRAALMAFFVRRMRNRAEAEDLTQEVFAKLAGQELKLRQPGAYVFQTAANLLRDRSRRAKVRSEYQVQQAADPESGDSLGPERVVAGRQSLRQVIEALQELPERTRTIFILHRLEKLRKGEVAALFGLSISGIDKHLIKALTHLHERLGEQP